ncbi:MAG TPA: S26 family signal peptidase, partial [Tepidisphaeraceae bacterium]
SKLDDVFTAEFTTTAVTLSRTRAGRPAEVLGQRPLKKSGPMRIEFQNVDYQVSVRVDGEDLIQTTPQQYAPNVKQLLEAYRSNIVFPRPTVEIEAEREQCSISHLRLWRDVYYRNREQRQSLQWAIPENFPEHLAILGDDEYFVMGDNSVISGDARYWGTPIKLPHEQLDVQSGRVPGRFLLGKAFFVYWPAGYRPTENAPALTPNFAEMRFIH